MLFQGYLKFSSISVPIPMENPTKLLENLTSVFNEEVLDSAAHLPSSLMNNKLVGLYCHFMAIVAENFMEQLNHNYKEKPTQ